MKKGEVFNVHYAYAKLITLYDAIAFDIDVYQLNIQNNLPISIINSAETAKMCVDVLREEKFITVDTEFIRENLQTPLLCLVQIASKQYNFIIDPFAVEISFLTEIFSSNDIVKVFHSAEQDIEMFRNNKVNIVNIHDTQMYEMLLDIKECISYQAIVNKYLGKRLNKDHSLSDWKKRPLSQSQLKYSIEDVFYLRSIYERQIDKLREKGCIGWLDSEMKALSEKNKNVDNINEYIYTKLLNWVKDFSHHKNISSEFIVSEKLIKSISKKGNEFVQKIKNSRYAKDENTLQFLNFAEELTEHEWFSSEKQKRDSVFYGLKSILAHVSLKNSIAASIIATSSDLTKIILGNRNVKCLFGWRKEIFGGFALAFLSGNLDISIKDSVFTMNFGNQ